MLREKWSKNIKTKDYIKYFDDENTYSYKKYYKLVNDFLNEHPQVVNKFIDEYNNAFHRAQEEVNNLYDELYNEWENDENNPYNDPEYARNNNYGYDASLSNLENQAAFQVGGPTIQNIILPKDVEEAVNQMLYFEFAGFYNLTR